MAEEDLNAIVENLDSDEGRRKVREFLERHPRWNIRHQPLRFGVSEQRVTFKEMELLMLHTYKDDKSNQQFIGIMSPAIIVISSPDGTTTVNDYYPGKLAQSFTPKMHAKLPLFHNSFEILDLGHQMDNIFSIYDPSFIWNAPMKGFTFNDDQPIFTTKTECKFMFCYCVDVETQNRYTIDMKSMSVTSKTISFDLPLKLPESTPIEVMFVVGDDTHLIASWTNLKTSFDEKGFQKSNNRVKLTEMGISIAMNPTITAQIVNGFKMYVSPICRNLVDGPHGVIPIEYYINLASMLTHVIRVMYQDTSEYEYVKLVSVDGVHILSFSTPTMAEPILLRNYETILPLPIRSLNATLLHTLSKRIKDWQKKIKKYGDDIPPAEIAEMKTLLDAYEKAFGDKTQEQLDFMNQRV